MEFFKYFEETYQPEIEKDKETEIDSLMAELGMELPDEVFPNPLERNSRDK